jgi:hypothetical protein
MDEQGRKLRFEIRRTLRSPRRARVSTIACLASLGALALVASPALSAQAPTINPGQGKPFVPTLGDWEGTANGFPASFSLVHTNRGGVRGYGINDVVALRPNGCPTASYRYSEAVIQSKLGAPLGSGGSLGLSRFGFGGNFVGARSATMSGRYRSGSCSGKLSWNMHPAKRTLVQAGAWRVRFADGESGSFNVLASGRLASSIEVPSALTSCDGVTGAVDLFIGTSGLAKVSQPNVHASIQFGRRSATGVFNAGGQGCADGPFHFTASLK